MRLSRYDRYRKADVFYGSAKYSTIPDLSLDAINSLVGGSGTFPSIGISEQCEDDTALTGSLTLR